MHRTRWAIIGGGVLGLTLSLRLRQRGMDVAVFEAAEQFGGLASAWQIGEVTWDRHYHVTLLSDTHLRGLLTELGLAEQLIWKTTRTGFYTDGRLHSMSSSWEFLRFPPLGLWDKLRLGMTIFWASRIKDWRPLEQITAADWLIRWSGQRTFSRIWEPLLRAKLGDNYRQASAAFIWAIIARMYAARRTGLKREMFGYVRGGYRHVLERFADHLEKLNVDLRARTPVRSVRSLAGEVVVEDGHGSHERFDRAIITAPAPVAAQLCPDLCAREKEQLSGVSYQGIVCLSLLLRRPLADFYVTNITESWVPYTAVIEMTALVDPAELKGHHLVYLPKYVTSDDPLLGKDDEAVRDVFLAGLERMYPHFRRADVIASRISRVRHVLPIPTLGYSTIAPSFVTSQPGVFLVNSAQIVNGTLNVNETIQLAERAVAALCPTASDAPALRSSV